MALTPVPRGVIRNRDEKRRILDFSGLRFGNITPTDIDGIGSFFSAHAHLEYARRTHIMIEVKPRAGFDLYDWLRSGQGRALEILASDLAKVKPTLVIVAGHDAQGDEDINVGVCPVLWALSPSDSNHWMRHPMTTRELIEMWLTRYGWKLNA